MKKVFFLSLVIIFSISCSRKFSSIPVILPLRSQQEELNFMKSKTDSLVKNKYGFWEAYFNNGLIMIYVPAGSFSMGNDALSSDVVKESYPASPAHLVSLEHYWISKFPVTLGQFRSFIESTNYVTDVENSDNAGPWVYDFSKSGFVSKSGYNWSNAYKDILSKFPEIIITDAHPVSCVSWYDAIAYTDFLSSKYDLHFTLPTEAEWEYAARGTDGRVYPWGNEVPDGTRANYADETFNKYFPNVEQALVHFGVTDGYAITSPVGSFPAGASPIGALDMAGNLTEWVYDSEYSYQKGAISNPINNIKNKVRMQKAGFWAGSAGRPGVIPDELTFGHNIRSDARQGDDPKSADDHLGFRIAISYISRK